MREYINNFNIKEEIKRINYKKYKYVLVFFIIVLSLLLYSRYISTSGLIVKEYKIESDTLPIEAHGFKIVHLSDIHYGSTINKNRLEAIVEEINLLKPDIVVLTGDLYDEVDINTEDIIEVLSKIEVSVAKYAISGNHDYVRNDYHEVIEASGFINLDNTYDLIYYGGYEPILIAGMSTNLLGPSFDKLATTFDYLNSFKNIEGLSEEQITSLKEDEPKYKILLVHEPDFIEDYDYEQFDLILAGHSHNGQVRLPFTGALHIPNGAKKYYEPYYDLGESQLYISSGLGTSTIDFRFFNKPSINLYRITKK